MEINNEDVLRANSVTFSKITAVLTNPSNRPKWYFKRKFQTRKEDYILNNMILNKEIVNSVQMQQSPYPTLHIEYSISRCHEKEVEMKCKYI